MVTANVEFEEACKTLGLDSGHTNANSINKAYREQAKKYHPDKNPGVDPGLFVRMTDAKNTALKYLKNNPREASPPVKALKLEVVPGETEFLNVGRREIKSREFIVYSVGGPFTRFSIDRRRLPKWIHISSITRTTKEELPVRVTIRITGPELGEYHVCHIPIIIENKNTARSEEIRVPVKLTMKPPKPQVSFKSFEFSSNQSSRPAAPILTSKNAGAGQIKDKPRSRHPWTDAEPAHVSSHDGQVVKIDSRKATLGLSIAAGALFLFSVICIANSSPPSFPSTEPPPQETAQIGKLVGIQETAAVIQQPAKQPEAPAAGEIPIETNQPIAGTPAGTSIIQVRAPVNYNWSPGSAVSDNVVSALTYPATPPIIPPVTTGEPNDTQQNYPPAETPVKPDTGDDHVNHDKKKDGKTRHPLEYLDTDGDRKRFKPVANPGPPRPGKQKND